MEQVFHEAFPNADVAKDVYIEGTVPFERFLGNFVQRKDPYRLFGGLGVFPDIAIKVPTLNTKVVFIELDHGHNGSKLKTALAKAAFDHMTLDCDYCLEFFHNRGKQRLKEFLNRQREQVILQKLETTFNTRLYLFEPNSRSG